MELSELTRKAEAAKELKDPTARRIALRAIFAAFTDYRIGAIEERLGITHEGIDDLQRSLGELNESFDH
ncbi:MAG: hypothetical protein OXH96_07425 [Spirochaetaceae bacterium]|nr:hypothetical protein [Spirochaetaceae bacterium]